MGGFVIKYQDFRDILFTFIFLPFLVQLSQCSQDRHMYMNIKDNTQITESLSTKNTNSNSLFSCITQCSMTPGCCAASYGPGTLCRLEMSVNCSFSVSVNPGSTLAMTEFVDIDSTLEMTESGNQSSTLAMTESGNKSSTLAMTESVNQSSTLAMTETVNQSSTLAMTESVNQSSTLAMTETVNQSSTLAMTESVNQSSTPANTESGNQSSTPKNTESGNQSSTPKNTEPENQSSTPANTEPANQSSTLAITESVNQSSTPDMTTVTMTDTTTPDDTSIRYNAILTLVPYDTAVQLCSDLGMELAVIKDNQTYDNVIAYINKEAILDPVWIGMVWENTTQEFRWTDNNDVLSEPILWHYDNEPNHMAPTNPIQGYPYQNCVRLVYGFFRTSVCTHIYVPLCQETYTVISL